MEAFLADVGIHNTAIEEILAKNHITLGLLKDMVRGDLQNIGIGAYGHQQKILKGIKKLQQGQPFLSISLIFLFSIRIANLATPCHDPTQYELIKTSPCNISISHIR